MSRPRFARSIALAALFLIPAGIAAAQDASPSPVTLDPEPGSAVHDVSDAVTMPQVLEPDPSIAQPTPTSWERLEVGPDGRTLRVHFSTGASGCYGLARVEVDRSGDVPVVTVWTGLRPEAASRLCDAMAYEYVTEIVLDEPLLVDGAE